MRIEHLDATAVSADFVNTAMARSLSRRIVLLLDCYAGAFGRGSASRAGGGVELKGRFDGRGRVVLTASNAMEYSYAVEGDFAVALSDDGLAGAGILAAATAVVVVASLRWAALGRVTAGVLLACAAQTLVVFAALAAWVDRVYPEKDPGAAMLTGMVGSVLVGAAGIVAIHAHARRDVPEGRAVAT